MSVEAWERADGVRHDPSLQNHPGQGSARTADDRAAGAEPHSAEEETDPVQARTPTRQERAPDERPTVDSLPLPDGRQLGSDVSGNQPRRGLRRRYRLAIALGLALFVPVATAGYLYWDNALHFQSTDDSFIAARQFAIQPEVSGYITAVPVTDNQHVATGDVVARIDDREYRIALDQADAQLAHDEAVLEQAQKDLGRYRQLAKRDAIAQQQVEDQTFLVAQDNSTVALDQAKVDQAKLNLSYTTVIAAQAGRVVSLNAAVGQYVQPGTALTMFIPDRIWITANFKETQLDQMRPGQPATIHIDAYPERIIRGHVASVQPGSGPAFSLLPPENATGNWVKVVQRVPVKIVIDNPPADVALGPGMSAEATVRVNAHPPLYERLKKWADARLGGWL